MVAYKKFEGFRNIVDSVFGFIKNGVKFLVDVFTAQFDIMYGLFKSIFNGVARLWNNTIGKIAITIPDIPGLPGRGKTFGVPEIPYLANGGIVTGPTLAMIGERGPEAVIPLSGPNAGKGMGGDTNVTIQVNGGDPQQVVNALRRYMQMNGTVPIRVSA